MTFERAVEVIGRRGTRHVLNNMVLALSLSPWRNTAEETERCEAAKVVLANWRRYKAVCP
jgi:hypothetical protein